MAAVAELKLVIDPEFKALIPPPSPEELQQLEANILADGCRDPIVVWDGIIVDGHNRFTICNRHGKHFKTTELFFVDREDVKSWIIRNQFGRRNLSTFQRAELALKLEPLISAKAKENQRASGGAVPSKLTEPHIDTREEIAVVAGVSTGTLHKAKVIAEKADEDTKEQLRRGDTSINSAYTDIKRKEKEERRQERRDENLELVSSAANPADAIKDGARFATIVIDPPWDWGDEGDCDQLGRAKPTYQTMPIDEIKALPLPTLADDDCHIYLWITNRSLSKGFELLEAWGFRYITCLTWCKPHFGMGNYFRGSSEQVLFGVKGSQPIKRKDVGTWFSAPRGAMGHSSKPVEFYSLVESCSPGPFLEMFARSGREGWTQWGAEIS